MIVKLEAGIATNLLNKLLYTIIIGTFGRQRSSRELLGDSLLILYFFILAPTSALASTSISQGSLASLSAIDDKLAVVEMIDITLELLIDVSCVNSVATSFLWVLSFLSRIDSRSRAGNVI